MTSFHRSSKAIPPALLLALTLAGCSATAPLMASTSATGAPQGSGQANPALAPTAAASNGTVVAAGSAAAPGVVAPVDTTPLLAGQMLSGSVRIDKVPMANATVNAYVPGSTKVLATATTDANGKFQMPISALSSAKLVKLVAKSSDKTLVTIYAVPTTGAPNMRRVLDAGNNEFTANLGAFDTELTLATTVSFVTVSGAVNVTTNAQLSDAQARQILTSFIQIIYAVSTGLVSGKSADANLSLSETLASSLSATGDGTISALFAQSLTSNNSVLASVLPTSFSQITGVLSKAVSSSDSASLAALTQTTSLGSVTLGSTTTSTATGGAGGGNGGASSPSQAVAPAPIVIPPQANGVGYPGGFLTVSSDVLAGGTLANEKLQLPASAYTQAFLNNCECGTPVTNPVAVNGNNLTVKLDSGVLLGKYTANLLVNRVVVGTTPVTVTAPTAAGGLTLAAPSAAEGTLFTLNGQNLQPYDTVLIGSQPVTNVTVNPAGTSLTAKVPYGTASGTVHVTAPNLPEAVTAATLTVTPGVPAVTALAPNSTILAGDILTVSGFDFDWATAANNSVTFQNSTGTGLGFGTPVASVGTTPGSFQVRVPTNEFTTTAVSVFKGTVLATPIANQNVQVVNTYIVQDIVAPTGAATALAVDQGLTTKNAWGIFAGNGLVRLGPSTLLVTDLGASYQALSFNAGNFACLVNSSTLLCIQDPNVSLLPATRVSIPLVTGAANADKLDVCGGDTNHVFVLNPSMHELDLFSLQTEGLSINAPTAISLGTDATRALTSDGNGGVWVGTQDALIGVGKLSHYDATGALVGAPTSLVDTADIRGLLANATDQWVLVGPNTLYHYQGATLSGTLAVPGNSGSLAFDVNGNVIVGGSTPSVGFTKVTQGNLSTTFPVSSPLSKVAVAGGNIFGLSANNKIYRLTTPRL